MEFPTADRELVSKVLTRLGNRDVRCGVAESCTGGLLGATITAIPGSSAVFSGGMIVYSNRLKQNLLGVPEEVLSSHGAVSAETAREMVRGVKERLGVEVSLSLTGVAGPEGGTPETPVGRVFGAVLVSEEVTVEKWQFPGDRDEVRSKSVQSILSRLDQRLEEAK